MFLLTNTRHNVSHLKNVIVNSQQVNNVLKNENDKLKEQNNALLEFLGTHWPALNVSGKVRDF
jgi:regulator of replication initiation timing